MAWFRTSQVLFQGLAGMAMTLKMFKVRLASGHGVAFHNMLVSLPRVLLRA